MYIHVHVPTCANCVGTCTCTLCSCAQFSLPACTLVNCVGYKTLHVLSCPVCPLSTLDHVALLLKEASSAVAAVESLPVDT